MEDKVISLLGLCKKAGKLTLGFDACMEAISKQKAFLILVTSDLSEGTLNKILRLIGNRSNLIVTDLSMDDINKVLGKLSGIISINNVGFAEKIKKLLTK